MFGDGTAVVVGLPPEMDLCTSIENSSEIRLATAFAHRSGWEMIERSVRRAKGKSKLLTGLDFCQTEPAVLKDWLKLVKERRALARLYIGSATTFHPKVMILFGQHYRFAIVGSGNLSAGGFRDNVECSVFVNDKGLVDDLQHWFDAVFTDEDATRTLTNPDIQEYEPKFKKARRHSAAIRKAQQQVQAKLAEQHSGELRRWRQALAAAKKYFKSDQFANWYPGEKKAAAKKIKTSLAYPVFNFSLAGWDEFYGIWDLGRLRQAWKSPAWKQHVKVQQGFRQLIDENIPVEERLSAVLDHDGKHKVTGVGLNIISKVLAVHKPKLWPVFNSPIEETLKAFEYHLPRGMRPSSKYLAFSEMMRKFMVESGAPDMLALDCFFYWYSKIRNAE
jgi:HKD family nuclease